MSDLTTLRSIPLFGGLENTQLQDMLGVMRSRRVPAGAAIVREGECGSELFILTSGTVEVTKRLGLADASPVPEKTKTLIRLTAPQFFGEMGLLEDFERSATVTAETDCELWELSRADFDRLAEADHLIGYRVARNIACVLSSRLRRTDRDVLKLTIALSLALGNQ